MTAQPVIRDATRDDFDAITDLTLDVYVGGGFVPPADPYAARLADIASRADDSRVLVAVVDDRVVGSIAVAEAGTPYAEIAEPGELEFRMLAVSTDARGLGVGTALVQYVLDLAAAQGCCAVTISTSASMVAARRIYDRLGFVHVVDRDWSPVPGVDLTVLSRPVSPAPSR